MFGGKEGDMTDSNDVGSDYEALVRRAMSQGLQGLDCTLVQLPSDQNGHHGVVLAAVTTDRGVFRAVGEAWRDLLPPARRGETLTTAEIRAKTRALREALGMPAASITHASAGSAEPANDSIRPEAEIVSTRVPATAASAAESSARSTARTGPAAPARAGTVSPVPTPSNEPDSRHTQVARAGTPIKPVPPIGPTNGKGGERSEEYESSEPEIPAKPSQMLVDGLGTDMLNRLLEMTKRKAAIEGNTAGDDEALQRLDSYFQRAFGHPLSDATRMEGQRVIQRLAADLSRSGTGSGRAVTG
jgi:hypothetical protein